MVGNGVVFVHAGLFHEDNDEGRAAFAKDIEERFARNGGPAFGAAIQVGEKLDDYACTSAVVISGMTLRDWFAGQAMKGLVASGANSPGFNDQDAVWSKQHQYRAGWAYCQADAMLAERSKQK